ncbi:MAG: hypothetical protein HC853_19065 [Anaerolineae bacterium]|nr:hypothetical protein [Anaerolineae bacterium]
MKAKYDFSKGVRGKFYRPGATFTFPIYLDPDIEKLLGQLAERKQVDVEKLVNDWLRANLQLVSQ